MASTDDATSVRALLRSFVVDMFNRHDLGVCESIMHDDYELTVGALVLTGRDEQYRPAVASQFEQFPHLAMTVHDVIADGRDAALVFSEHGASGGPGGRVASWTGVALYRSDGRRLTSCVTVEDYAARKRQLKSGVPDPVPPAAPAPWDTCDLDADSDAIATVRAWLESGADLRPDADEVSRDDSHVAGVEPFEADVAATEVTHLFASGRHVAFHAAHTTIDGRSIHAAGLVEVANGAVARGHVVRDRATFAASS